MNKKVLYYFKGKVKDLCKDIDEEIEAEFDKEIEEGFLDNMFCDTYGYCCGTGCKNYYDCQIN